jgi:hypothetical protein
MAAHAEVRPSWEDARSEHAREDAASAERMHAKIDALRAQIGEAESEHARACEERRRRRALDRLERGAELVYARRNLLVPLARQLDGTRDAAVAFATACAAHDAEHRRLLGTTAGVGDEMAGSGWDPVLAIAEARIERDPLAINGIVHALLDPGLMGPGWWNVCAEAHRAFRVGDPASCLRAVEGLEAFVADAATQRRTPATEPTLARWAIVMSSATRADAHERITLANHPTPALAERRNAQAVIDAAADAHRDRIERARSGDDNAAEGQPQGWLARVRSMFGDAA